MKFLHAADIHLDSPMRGLERYEGAPVEEMRNATRAALKNMVRLCLDEQVDLVLISGDIYDREWKDFNTGLFFIAQVARLTREGIPVVLIRGNHDAASQISLRLRLPESGIEPVASWLGEFQRTLYGSMLPARVNAPLPDSNSV